MKKTLKAFAQVAGGEEFSMTSVTVFFFAMNAGAIQTSYEDFASSTIKTPVPIVRIARETTE